MLKTAKAIRIRRGDTFLTIDPAFDLTPIYHCTHFIFDNNNIEKESPVAHLARFIDYLETTPRSFSVGCVGTLTIMDDPETSEEEENCIHEAEMAEIPELLALKRPEILTFTNTEFTVPRITTIQMTGEVDVSYTMKLDAYEYAMYAISNCHLAKEAIPEDLRRRLELIFPS